eukprot:GEZU01001996.1.p1 GENE.GEZU01001996.1~~GEZU01001996.1.p1  ORF type:complete len:377 (-),score=92.29 GEZU01001996.1:201-1331(-)
MGDSVKTNVSAESNSPQEAILKMTVGFWASQALFTATELGIFDQISKAGPQTAEELAAAVKAAGHSLFRLMRAVASLGLLSIVNDSDSFVGVSDSMQKMRFDLTPMSKFLVTDVQGSMRDSVLLEASNAHYSVWALLRDSVRTGKEMFPKLHGGMQYFEYCGKDLNHKCVFDRAMSNYSAVEADAVITSYDFSTVGTLVDVGGSIGGLLFPVLEKHPIVNGVLFDLPQVLQDAKVPEKLSSRVQVVPGSFFDASTIPSNGDAYILKHVIHDWSDEKSIEILTNVRKVMPPHAKLLLAEYIVPTNGTEPHIAKMIDLHMMLMLAGRERTLEEFCDLFSKSGFTFTKVYGATTGSLSNSVKVIEAVPGPMPPPAQVQY